MSGVESESLVIIEGERGAALQGPEPPAPAWVPGSHAGSQRVVASVEDVEIVVVLSKRVAGREREVKVGGVSVRWAEAMEERKRGRRRVVREEDFIS